MSYSILKAHQQISKKWCFEKYCSCDNVPTRIVPYELNYPSEHRETYCPHLNHSVP